MKKIISINATRAKNNRWDREPNIILRAGEFPGVVNAIEIQLPDRHAKQIVHRRLQNDFQCCVVCFCDGVELQPEFRLVTL